MDQSGPRGLPAQGDGGRVIGKDGLSVRTPLKQAHALAAFDIDGRNHDHKKSKVARTSSRPDSASCAAVSHAPFLFRKVPI